MSLSQETPHQFGIGVLLQLSWLDHRASPSSLLGSAQWPCSHTGLGNILSLQNTFVQCIAYSCSFLSAHILYLPGHMPKLCKLGLTLNKETTSVTGFHLVYVLQQSVSPHLLSHRLSLVLQLSQQFVFSEVNERDSPTLACCWPTSNCWTQLWAHKLEVSARSSLESMPGTAAITDIRMWHDIFT